MQAEAQHGIRSTDELKAAYLVSIRAYLKDDCMQNYFEVEDLKATLSRRGMLYPESLNLWEQTRGVQEGTRAL